MNVSEKMREVLPKLKEGVGSVRFPYLKIECEENWTPDYAIVQGMHHNGNDVMLFDTNDYVNFDEYQLREDFQKKVIAEFPGCDITFYWHCGEIEVSKTQGKGKSKIVVK